MNDIPENNAWHASQAGWEKYYQTGPKQSFLFLIPLAIEAIVFYILNYYYSIFTILNIPLYEGVLIWIDFALIGAMTANLLLVLFSKTFLSNLIRALEYSLILYAFFKLLVVFPFNLEVLNLEVIRPWVTIFLVLAIIYCGLVIIIHIVRFFMGYKD